MDSSSRPFEVQLEYKLHLKSDLEAQRAGGEGLECDWEAVFVLHFFFLHHHLLLLRCTPLSESVLDGRACRNEHRALVGTAERS